MNFLIHKKILIYLFLLANIIPAGKTAVFYKLNNEDFKETSGIKWFDVNIESEKKDLIFQTLSSLSKTF